MRRVYDPQTPVEPAFSYRESHGVQLTTDPPAPVFAPGQTLAVDIETVGVDVLAFQVKVITIGTADHVVAFDPRHPRQLAAAARTIADAGRLVFHKSSFDVPPLVWWGAMTLDDIDKVYDTLILARMAQTLNNAKRDLTSCISRYCGVQMETDVTAMFKAAGYPTKAAGFAEMDIDSPAYLTAAMLDTAYTVKIAAPLYDAVLKRMTDNPFTDHQAPDPHRIIEREQIVNRVMLRRSAIGIPVDLDVLDRHRIDNEREAHRIETELHDAGIRVGNGNDLTAWLHNAGALPEGWPTTAKTGKWSTKAEHLEELSHPFAAKFVWHKQLERVETYMSQVESYARITGKLHPQVEILGASATGRMAYGGGVPLQGFSAGARGILLAEPGRHLVSIDWSSIEPIMAANCSSEQTAIDLYESGGDLYAPAVEAAGVTRKVAKTVLLAQLYGQGVTSLARRIDRTDDEAKTVRDAIMGQYPAIRSLLFSLKHLGDTVGAVPTISGRIVDAPRIEGRLAGYKCQNYFHQGSAYDVLAETISSLHAQGAAHTVVLAMHDELVIEADPAYRGEDIAFIRQVMQTPPDDLCRFTGRVPILRTDVEVLGERWAKPE